MEAVLSDQLGAQTLLRQVEAALAVQPLPHLAGAFPGGAPDGVSPTHLVPARLFEDEPDVPDPERRVYKSKDLQGRRGLRAGVSGLRRVCRFLPGSQTHHG